MQPYNTPQYYAPPPPPAYSFLAPLPPALAARKGIQRTGNLTAAALLAFSLIGSIIILIASPILAVVDRVDLTFLVTLACNGLAGFFALYCIFNALMKPRYLNCRDAVGEAFGRPVSASLLIYALFIGFALALCSSQLTSFFLKFLEYLGMPSTDLMPDIMPKTFNNTNIAMLVVQIAVSPALLEEFAFRGVMMQSLRRYGDGFAIVASSLIFGIFHGNIVQAPFAFLLGLVMGWLTIATGSIWTAVLIHFVNNLNSVIITVLGSSMEEEALNKLYYFIIFPAAFILGAISLVLFFNNKKRIKLKPIPQWTPKQGRMAAFLSSPVMIILLVLNVLSMVMIMFLPQLSESLGIDLNDV